MRNSWSKNIFLVANDGQAALRISGFLSSARFIFLLRTTVITHFPKLGRKDNGKMIRNLSNKIDQYSKGEEKHRITQLKIP